ncbi:hypothetical protein [Nonomuraea ferruginea]|uniref:Uncharacterized protein n=1 Tax=Nonomuraea ferruginea TaxID=46174 RepID=A0ABT4TD14_9ACTN|nr:hypothetical protein [Nonomuraea ferruginea]MDA0647409.1 hypothetical protein [Nonomuraea ferruginea]
MNRGWMVAGVLALVAAPVVPAAAAGVAMVLERVDDPAGMVRWIRTGDVLRYEVRLSGMAEDASLAVAATPVHSLTGLSCARHVPPPDTPDPGGAEITARALAARALTAPDGVAVPGAQACHLGDVSSEKAVQVVLSVPSGAEEVEVAAVARLREGDGGLTTILRTATTSVADESSTMNGPAAPVPDPWDESRDPRAVEEREFGRWEAGERARRETWQEWPGDRRRMRAAEPARRPEYGEDRAAWRPERGTGWERSARDREGHVAEPGHVRDREGHVAEPRRVRDREGFGRAAEFGGARDAGSAREPRGGEDGAAGRGAWEIGWEVPDDESAGAPEGLGRAAEPDRAHMAGPARQPGAREDRAAGRGEQGSGRGAPGAESAPELGDLGRPVEPGRVNDAESARQPGDQRGGAKAVESRDRSGRPEAGKGREEHGRAGKGWGERGREAGKGAEERGREVGKGAEEHGREAGKGAEEHGWGAELQEPSLEDGAGEWPAAPDRTHQHGEVKLPEVAPPPVEAAQEVVPGAPLPRTVDGAQVSVRAAERTNPLAGVGGLPYVAGGIGVLLVGLWAVAKAQARRMRRKVF